MPEKPKRARPRLPDWAVNPEKYQYKQGLGGEITKRKDYILPTKINDNYYSKRKKDAIKKVLTTEW